MGKQGKKPVVEVEEKEESDSNEEFQLPEENEDDMLGEDKPDEQELELQQQQQVLEIIKVQTQEGTDGEKLTWLSLYSLKQEQIELSIKMNLEINLIKDKYDLLKQPIFQGISKAANGMPVEKALYSPEGLPKPANADKIVPSALPNFWLKVFTNSGLIEDDVDFDLFSKLSEFTCELVDTVTNEVKLTFKFKEEPSLFTNKTLTISSKNLVVDGEITHVIKKDTINLKGDRNDNSVFTGLFANEEDAEACELVVEFYRDYSNSVYFYMKKDELEGEDEEEDLSDEEEEEEKVKPKKKVKKDLEKPECKNQ